MKSLTNTNSAVEYSVVAGRINAHNTEAADALTANISLQASTTRALENQVGLGVDIVEIARMAAVLKRTPRFKQRVFTEGEQSYCESMANPVIHYATRFAAKEAVVKTLGTGFSWGVCDPRNIEVCRNAKGKPYVVLYGKVKEVACAQHITEIPLSLSYTHSEAVACALALTDTTNAARTQANNPVAQLTEQFRQLRGMLDEDLEEAIEEPNHE